MKRLGAKNVYISSVVDNSVIECLESEGLNVISVYGNNTAETSVKIAETIKSINPDFLKGSSIALINGKGTQMHCPLVQ
jgi:putative cell wall-binding protein